MYTRAVLLAAAAGLLLLVPVTPGAAQERPFQLAVVGPALQLVDEAADIQGIRFNLIYGVNRNMTGLDLGLINHTRSQLTGVGFGLVNVADGGFSGWQSAAVNMAGGHFTGLQWSPWTIGSLANFAEAGEGAQIAIAFNRAQNLRGFQLSLVNVADDMYGVQVGLINIIRSKPDFWILPLINWKLDQ